MKRTEIIPILWERDGGDCAYPDCDRELDLDVEDGKWLVTVDHYMPISWCKEQGCIS